MMTNVMLVTIISDKSIGLITFRFNRFPLFFPSKTQPFSSTCSSRLSSLTPSFFSYTCLFLDLLVLFGTVITERTHTCTHLRTHTYTKFHRLHQDHLADFLFNLLRSLLSLSFQPVVATLCCQAFHRLPPLCNSRPTSQHTHTYT